MADGRDDDFLADGKTDSGIAEGSREAIGVLRVANTTSLAVLRNDVGLAHEAASNIVAYRSGDDEMVGTSDDMRLTTLAELDAIPFIGPIAFAQLLDYARAHDLIPPPADGSLVCDGCPWVTETVTQSTALVLEASIAFGLDGAPHIVYWDQERYELRHAQQDPPPALSTMPRTWTSTTIATASTSSQTDLVVDAAGTLHLAASGRYFTYENGTWTERERFTGSNSVGAYGPKWLLGADGVLRVAFLRNSAQTPIQLATRTAAGWEVETVESDIGGDHDDVLDATLTADGRPVLFYRAMGGFHFAVRAPNGTWSIETVVPTQANYATVSVHARPNGYFTLVHPSGYGKLAMREGVPGSWVQQQIASGWGVLAHAPADETQLVHIGYQSLNDSWPLLVTTRREDHFETAQLLPDTSNGSGVSDALVGPDGKLWFVLGGFQQLRVFHQ